MNNNILRIVARRNGVSVREVRAEIQAAIDDAYADPSNRAAWRRYGFDSRPNVGEFLTVMARQIKKELPAKARSSDVTRILN